jgi:hypothetical protein
MDAAREVRLSDVVEDQMPSQPRIATNNHEFKSPGSSRRGDLMQPALSGAEGAPSPGRTSMQQFHPQIAQIFTDGLAFPSEMRAISR